MATMKQPSLQSQVDQFRSRVDEVKGLLMYHLIQLVDESYGNVQDFSDLPSVRDITAIYTTKGDATLHVQHVKGTGDSQPSRRAIVYANQLPVEDLLAIITEILRRRGWPIN